MTTPDLSVIEGSDRRVNPRRAILWPGTLQVGSHEFKCQIWNMSLGGAKVRTDIPLRSGADAKLLLKDETELTGDIVWSGDKSVGVEFHLPAVEVRDRLGKSVATLGLD